MLDATAAGQSAQRPRALLREVAVSGLGQAGAANPAAVGQPDAQCFFEGRGSWAVPKADSWSRIRGRGPSLSY